MSRFLLACLLLSSFLKNSAQVNAFPQWGELSKGKYAVGYRDTVILKTDEQFTFYTYKKNKPFFVGIWYPAEDNSSVSFMQFKNYLDFSQKNSYQVLYDSIIKIFKTILVADGVSITINGGPKEISFDETQQNLYEDILNTRVSAKRNLKAVGHRFPCIIYHHGAQSTPYDNNVFCEYMASHGFVVVSSNYNLPDETQPNHLVYSTDKKFDKITDLSFVIKQAKRMNNVDTTQLIAAGHSAGAQIEMLFDTISSTKPFRTIISFHSTLENKSLATAKKYWPSFTYLFENHSGSSTTPLFLLAPLTLDWDSYKDSITGKEIVTRLDTSYPKYLPFRNNTTSSYTFVTVKHTVTHDGFITLGNLRFPYAKKYHLADRDNIVKQQYYYEQIILFAHKIAVSALHNSGTSSILTNKDFLVEHGGALSGK